MPAFVSNVNLRKRSLKLAADNPGRRLAGPLAIVAAIAVIDQISKLWAVAALKNGETLHFIGDFIRLKLVYNMGGALGSNLGGSLFYLLSSIAILVIVFYFLYIYRHSLVIAWSLAAIAGGAVGNIVDRFRLGKVIDFIDMDFFDISLGGFAIERWWTYNVADVAITLGEIALLIYIIASARPSAGPKKDRTDTSAKLPENR